MSDPTPDAAVPADDSTIAARPESADASDPAAATTVAASSADASHARQALPPRTTSMHAGLAPVSSPVAHHPLALHVQTAELVTPAAAAAAESASSPTPLAGAAPASASSGLVHPLSLTLPTSPPAIEVSSSSSAHLLSLPPGAVPSVPPSGAGVSPSVSPPPPPPPLFLDAFKGVPRLADYFLVLGRINDSETPLVPMRKLSRSNSQTIQPISDVTLVQSKELRDVPQDYTRCTDFAGRDVDCNPGLLKTSCFLAESRVPRRRGSQPLMPVTGLDVIWLDKKESPRPGFVPLVGNLNKGGLGHNVALCVERDPHKSPLIEIRVVCVPGGSAAIKEAQKWAGSLLAQPETPVSGPVSFPAHIPNPFAALIPNEYIRVDRALNEKKELFLVYKIAKRRAVEYMSYEPFLVDRYPEADHKDFPLETAGVSMLCFPRGMLLKPEPALPNFMTFVLTQASGREVYGAALIFYEQMPADPQHLPGRPAQQQSTSSAADRAGSPIQSPNAPGAATAASATSSAASTAAAGGVGASNAAPSDPLPVAYCPRCLCLLSHYPFYGLFQTFLNQLYRIAVSPSNMPLERFIGHFFHQLPVPRPYIPNVTYSIGHAKVTLSLPPACGLPYKNFSLLTLFRCLSVQNVVALFEHVLSEGKVVFYSNSHTTLTPVAEGIRLLLWPMKWQCVFIPILPTNLAYTVRAPVPFLIGLHRSFLDELKVPDDVLLVDLDRNRLSMPNNLYRPAVLNPLTGLPETPGGGATDGPHNPHAGSNSDFASHGGGQHGASASASQQCSPNGTAMHSDSKLLYPLPEFMREWLTADLLEITTSPVDGVTLLYQAQDLSEEDLSLFHPPMLDSDFNLEPAQVEQQETRIRLAFLKIMIRFLGGYRKHIVLKAEESESFFDLDRLFDRAAFAKSFQSGPSSVPGDGDSLYRFARQLADTQIFSDFILNRVTNTTDFQGLFFFDYCVALQQEDAATGQPIAILPSASTNSPHVHASSSVSAAVAAVASSAVVSAHPVVTPTAAQLRMHHHAKSPSELTREMGKLEKLKSQLKKRSGATGASPQQQMQSMAAMQDLMRSGSLTFQTLEAIKALPPSLVPMPRHWMSLCYSVPPPDSSALPEGRGPYEYDTFPSLDPMKFGEYGPASAVEAEIARNLATPSSPNSPLRWLMAPHPSTTSGHTTGASAAAPAPSPAKPSHTRGSVGAKKSPASRRGTELEALDAAIAANEHARGKILVSLYQHINALQERIRLMNGNDRAALPHAAMIYELWFALFTSQCEKERARKRAMRRRRIAEGTYWPVSFLSPQSGHRNSVGAAASSPDSSPSGSPTSGRGSIGGGGSSAFFDAHLSEAALRAEEHRECLSDLLLLFIELHSMVSKGGVLPTERLLEDLSLFALKMNLVREFQEIYRLFSTSVPHLSTRFFNQLIRIGITTPIRNPQEALAASSGAEAAPSEESKAMQRKIAAMLPPAGPPTPDDPLSQLMRAKATMQLSTFDNLSSPLTAPPLPPEEVPSYSYPISVTTSARCGRCQYELGGEDILVGWMLHADRLSTSCPLCESHVTPYLLVRLHDQAHEVRVEYMRPSAIRSTLHSLALLRREPDVEPSLSYFHPEAGSSATGGSGSHGGNAVRAEVGRSEYLTSIRSSSLLFWNTFWAFACRGPKSRGGFGQLPCHFLFASDDSDSVLSRVQQSYTSDCGPYRPWRVTADLPHPSTVGVGSESAGSNSSSSVNSPFQSLYLMGQRGRGLSWETSAGSQEVRAAIGETLQAFGASASSSAQEPLAVVAATAAAAAAATTQPRKGSILRHSGDSSSGNGSSKVNAPAVSRKISTGGAASLLNTLLEPAEGSNAPGSARVKFCDSDDESSRRNSSAGFKLEVPPSMVRDSSPDLDGLDEAAAHHRRSSLAWSNVRYTMHNVKSRPVQQAVRTILRARLARRGWSVEDRAEDEPHFSASMYQQIAQLLPDPVDPVGFAAEYKAALASIDASMEQHRKQIETLEAASSNILSSVLGAGAGDNKSKDSAAAAAGASQAGAGVIHVPLKTEDAAALELKRRKKEAVSAALEECIQMKNEVLPQDAPPTAASIQLLMSVRRVFGFELHKSIVRAQVQQLTQHQRSFSFTDSGTAAGVLAGKQLALSGGAGGGGGAVYGSILDEILVNDIPSLEDVLTQVSHNPAYTLQGFMKFCLKFRTHSEINKAAETGAAEATGEVRSTAVAVANGAPASAPTSTALSYVEFWSAVRRWRVRYERNDRNRSLSLITKGPSGELYDSVYESAKSIYTRFLITPLEAEVAAAGGAAGGKGEIRMLPAAAAGASIVDSMGMAHARRKSSLTSIAEMSPHAGAAQIEEAGLTAAGGHGASTALSVSVSSPSAANSSMIPASSHFNVNPTPMGNGGHVTTVRGLILPRPLHENIRRTLCELKVDTVPAIDPLLGTSVPSLISHHAIPKYLFDDAAQVVLNWLKKHCFTAFVNEIKAAEEEEQEEEERATAEKKKQAKENAEAAEAAQKAAQLAAAASSSEAATHAAIAAHSPQPHSHAVPPVSTLALPTHNPDGSLRTRPPIPPRPLRADGTHSGSSSATNTPVAGSRPASISGYPAGEGAAAGSGLTPLHLPLSKLALNDGVEPLSSSEAAASTDAGKATSPQANAASARLMGLDPLATASPSPSPSPAAAAVPVVRVSPPSAPASAPAAPLPLLHNLSDVSARVAKSGTHVPDYSSASPPTEP